MLKYMGRRALQLIPVLFGVTLAVFIMSQVISGDVVDYQLGGSATQEDRERLRNELGLDENVVMQYLHYLGNLLQGDFGQSVTYGEPALGVLLDRLGNTVIIAVPAVILAAVVGIAAGAWAARRPNSLQDRGVTVLVLFLTSMPSFWLGMILILIFGLTLKIAPISGMVSIVRGGGILDIAAHAVLPVITLAVWSVAIITRMTRASMLQTLASDYVRTARSRGIPERKVIYRHALGNAMPPVITVIGLQAGFLLSGAVLTETVFSWPGIGLAMSQAITGRDSALLQGGILLIAIIFVIINFIVDVLYAYFNPKIKIG